MTWIEDFGEVRICIAIAIAFLGFAFIVIGLWRDRSRKGRRCPTCWFSLIGHQFDEESKLVCPECGRVTRKEKHLYRKRRAKRMLFLGGVLFLAGLGYPKVSRDGSLSIIPVPCMVLVAPGAGKQWVDSWWKDTPPEHWLAIEMIRRVESEQLTDVACKAWLWRVRSDCEAAGIYGINEAQRERFDSRWDGGAVGVDRNPFLFFDTMGDATAQFYGKDGSTSVHKAIFRNKDSTDAVVRIYDLHAITSRARVLGDLTLKELGIAESSAYWMGRIQSHGILFERILAFASSPTRVQALTQVQDRWLVIAANPKQHLLIEEDLRAIESAVCKPGMKVPIRTTDVAADSCAVLYDVTDAVDLESAREASMANRFEHTQGLGMRSLHSPMVYPTVLWGCRRNRLQPVHGLHDLLVSLMYFEDWDSWEDATATMTYVGRGILVTAGAETHDKIEAILNRLKAVRGGLWHAEQEHREGTLAGQNLGRFTSMYDGSRMLSEVSDVEKGNEVVGETVWRGVLGDEKWSSVKHLPAIACLDGVIVVHASHNAHRTVFAFLERAEAVAAGDFGIEEDIMEGWPDSMVNESNRVLVFHSIGPADPSLSGVWTATIEGLKDRLLFNDRRKDSPSRTADFRQFNHAIALFATPQRHREVAAFLSEN